LGPLLKPLLEQAADPIHEYRAGNNPFQARQTQSQIKQPTAVTPKSTTNEQTPNTVTIFKPKLESGEISDCLDSCSSKRDQDLFVEIKDFLEQADLNWSIGLNHVKFSCKKISVLNITIACLLLFIILISSHTVSIRKKI
jgi:hypothetical protein